MLQFIENIRGSDHGTKIKWLIILSSVSMVIVVLIWIAALKIITTNIENPPVQTVADSGPSLADKFSSAFSEIRERTATAFGQLKGAIGSNKIELKQPQ